MTLIAALAVVLALCCFLRASRVSRAQHLADGSWLRIREAVVSRELSFTFVHGNPIQRLLGRTVPSRWQSMLPWPLRSKCFASGSAGMHLSGEGKVCLFILTDRENFPATGELHLQLLVVGDAGGQGTISTPCLVTVDHRFQGWAFQSFPRDNQTLRLRCLASGPDGHLLEAAMFKLRNPAFGHSSAWSAQPASNIPWPDGSALGRYANSAQTDAPSPAQRWKVEWGEPSTDLREHMAEWTREGWKVVSISRPLPQADGTVHRQAELWR